MSEQEQSLIGTIQDLKRHEPFEPFRIVMTSGDKYLIEAGENLVIGESRLFYCVPRSDRVVYLRINQIAGIEQFGERSAA